MSEQYNDPAGVHRRVVAGQLMLCLPTNTPYRLTLEEAMAHIEQSANKSAFDKLSPAAQLADRHFHEQLQARVDADPSINERYVKERAAQTLAGGQVVQLTAEQQEALRRKGVLNDEALVNEYRRVTRSVR